MNPIQSLPSGCFNRVWSEIQPGLIVLVISLSTLATAPPLAAQESANSAPPPNEKALKYHSALQGRPSGGYLFDRFFNAWLDTGTIDGLGDFLKRRAAASGAVTADRLLHGYFLVKLGREAEALAVFETALEADPENTDAWAESAKARARMLDFEKALADLDKALATKPKEELAIELGKLKGRWLSRSGKSEEALTAWRQLAEAHPGDAELREDLVDLQLAESLVEEALATQSALVESTTDPYLKITRKLRLGDIHLRAGQTGEAKKVYGESLDAAGRDTWLEKEILAQIEQLFRREDDLAGLKRYYAELSETESGRVAVLRRRALVLAELEEADEAIAVYREILRITPGDRGNREGFVDLLGRLGRTEDAIEQMTALAETHPDDAELVVQLAAWQHAAKRPDAARDSVLRYLEMSDGSEYAHLRAARLLEQFEQADAAGKVFGRLIAKFPDSLSVREERAGFLYRNGKKDEAIAIWQRIAKEGTNQDAIRAARMLSSRGQRETAYEILKKRADDFAADPVFLGRLCEEAMASGHAAEAIPWMEKRIALVTAPGDLSAALRQAAAILERAEETANYREKLRSESAGLSVARACLLAELLERNGEYDAAETILRPLMDRGELLALHQRGRQLESRNEWEEAAEVMRRIIELPDGRRSSELERLVELYRRGFKYEEALTWIEAWKELSPGSPRPWLEQARIQNENGKTGEAIETLRRASGRFEDEESVRTLLASYFQQQGKPADAERIYWNLYEESPDIGTKIRWAGQLASMASAQGQIDRLVKQLEERRRANRTSIAPLLAIAEVHRRTGDYEGRREALLEATRLRPEDLSLLHQIATIEEQEGDWDRAIDTLESALPLDQTDRTERRIALFHLRYGDEEEGYRRLMELRGGDAMAADSVLGVADAFIARNAWERARALLDEHRDRFPDDYRIGYLSAVVLEETQEDERAIEAFLDLLSHDKELPQQAGASAINPLVVRSTAINAYYGEMPNGYAELFEPSRATYQAFQYRSRLRSSRIQFSSGFSGSAGGLVNLPGTLKELRAYSLTHLHWFAQSLDETEIQSLAQAIGQRDVRNAEILLALPFTDPSRYQPRPFDGELLDRFPDNLALMAAVVTNQASLMRNRSSIGDPELMARCYEKLLADFPQLALTAALCAAVAGDDEGVALLEKALGEVPEIDVPSGMLSSTAGSLLMAQAGEEFLSSAMQGALTKKLRTWLETQRLNAATKNQSNLLARFSPGDQYAAILGMSDDLSEYAAYLEEQCEEFTQTTQASGSLGRSQSGLGQYLRYMTQNQALLSPLGFPPLEIPGIPGNVLVQFVETPGYDFGNRKVLIEMDDARRLAAEVSDPILSALFLNLAGDPEATEAKVEELLAAATGDRNRPPLREALLAAGWFQKTEQWEKAAGLLESIRLLPMSSVLRQRIDGALMFCASESELEPEAFQAADAEGLAKWGPAAALRLRYGFLSRQRRGELVAALETFGLEEEAERLEAKGTVHPGSSASGSIVRSSAITQGIEQAVAALIKDKKTEQAEKLLSRTLEQSTRPIATSGFVQWDSNLIRIVWNFRQRNPKMMDRVIKQAKPAADAKASDHLHYAALMELDGRFDEAAGAYQAAYALMSGSGRKNIVPRLALLQGMADPEAGAKLFSEIDHRQLPQMGRLAESILQIFAYRGNRDHSQLGPFLNLVRMYTSWMNANGDDPAFARTDLSWIAQHGIYPLTQHMGSLPELYLNKTARLFHSPSVGSSSKWQSERRAVHDDLCRAMVNHPQMASTGFASLACLRIGEAGEAAFSDPKLVKLANRALETSSTRNPSLTAPPYSSWSHLRNDKLPLWAPEEFLIWRARLTKAGAAAAELTLAAVAKSKDRDRQSAADAFFTLTFGSSDEFAAALGRYLDSGQVNMPGTHLAELANHPMKSRAVKAFQIWETRREELGEAFDMETFLAGAVKKARQTLRNESTLLAVFYVESLTESDGWPAAKKFVYQLTEIWLGDQKRWDRFVKESQRKVPAPGGGFYYQGGEFTHPYHKQYSGFLAGCGWRPTLVFNVTSFAEEAGIDDNKQISQMTGLSQLGSSAVTSNPEMVRSLFQDSPFLESPSRFRAGLPQQVTEPLFKKLLDGAAAWKDEKAKRAFRQFLTAKDSFGAKLALAYLDDKKTGKNGPKKLPEVLSEYRAEIEAMPEAASAELATLVSRIYPDGVPGENGLSEDAIATLDHLGAERAKSVIELAKEFLNVKNLPAIGIDAGYELERKIAPMIDPLLKSKNWDLMEKVYWHCIELGEKEQKKGNWRGYDTGWNFPGSFLYDLLNDTEGGGLERIGFFERVVRSDCPAGRIAITGGGMRFPKHIRSAYDRYGGGEDMEKAMNRLSSELWELSGGEGPQSMLAAAFVTFINPFSHPDKVRLIAWADAHSEGEDWSPLARELGQAWRQTLAITDPKGFGPHKAKIPNFDHWEPHYLSLIQDDALSIPWRLVLAAEIAKVKTEVDPDLLNACFDLVAQALSKDSPFNGWSYVYILRAFNAQPKEDRWVAMANRIHEGWNHKNRNNGKDSGFGLAWDPWSNPVLLTLEMHCKLGDWQKLKRFRNEANAAETLEGNARTVFCLAEHGFIDEALEELNRASDQHDIGTDYPTAKSDYAPRYNSRIHQQLPKFLEKIDDPGLRLFAEVLLLGAPDSPPNEREKDPPYLMRSARLVDAAKRFPEVDFQGDEGLQRSVLRQFAKIDNASWILRERIAEAFQKIDLEKLASSQDYRQIEFDVRIPAAHAGNRLRAGDLEPLRQFITATNASSARDYYRREAFEHFGLRLAESVRNRAHNMPPKDIRAHADAFHLLVTEPVDSQISHSGIQATVIAKIATEIFASRTEGVNSQLDDDEISEARLKNLSRYLYTKPNLFWSQMTQAFKFNVPNLKLRPDDAERQRRAEAILTHPIVRAGLGKEKNLWSKMETNNWVKAGERESEWGKSLMAAWQENQAAK